MGGTETWLNQDLHLNWATKEGRDSQAQRSSLRSRKFKPRIGHPYPGDGQQEDKPLTGSGKQQGFWAAGLEKSKCAPKGLTQNLLPLSPKQKQQAEKCLALKSTCQDCSGKPLDVAENRNTTFQNLWETAKKKKRGLRGKFLVIQLLWETKKLQISNLTLYLEKLEKDEQTMK